LAAVAVGKGARCLSPDGREFRSDKIEFLLEERQVKNKFRRSGEGQEGRKSERSQRIGDLRTVWKG